MFQKRKNLKKQAASALISAIFITAVVAVLATAIAVRQRLLIYHAELVTSNNNAYLALQFTQQWAISELNNYAKNFADKKNKRMLVQLNPVFTPQQIMQMRVSGQLLDQQGLYNINDLNRTADIPNFVRLLQAVDPKLTKRQAILQAEYISQWMQKNADDSYYLKQNPPYRAGHQQLVDISTLRAVRSINSLLYTALQPYLTAIPLAKKNLTINVNTASAPVLLTLSPSLTLDQAQTIVRCRQQYGGFTDSANFENACVKPLNVAGFKKITVLSRYFILRAVAEYNNQRTVLTTMLQIATNKKTKLPTVKIVWQRLS